MFVKVTRSDSPGKEDETKDRDKTPGPLSMITLGSDESDLNYNPLDLIGCHLESVMKEEVLKSCKMRGFVYVKNGP